MHHAIIGNGVAGINAAGEIRRRDSASKITIISEESDHFFSRTALMYVFCGQMNETDIEPFPRDHYQRMNYERIRDKVTEIDATAKKIKLMSGQSIDYDRLLIAAGSVGRKGIWPGSDLEGVGSFVTLFDLEWLKEKSRTAKNACIIGGGLIGIEVAEILSMAGIRTTFLIREDYFWPVALNRDEGKLIVEHMSGHGIDVKCVTSCKEIIGKNGKVTALATENGQVIDCDLVVITIGVVPQTDWLADSEITTDQSGGIVVDRQLKTNQNHIWAAGDCTSVEWFNGIRRPEQLWYTSRDQGRIAGRNMTGANRDYKRATFYNSAKLFDIEYTTAGYVNFNFDGESDWYHREPGTYITQRVTYLPDGSVIGFNMLGRRWDHRILVSWVEEKRRLDWVLKNLHRANFDEEFFPKFKLAAGN